MNGNAGKHLSCAILLFAAFVIWTWLVMTADVQPIGPGGSAVGLARLNLRFHALTGVHLTLYTLTDWLGLIPVGVCMFFGALGLRQWIARRSLFKVDRDLLILGFHYAAVIAGYFFFEAFPVNYRPILTNGILEASYPSSTTLLVLSVMPTLVFQTDRRAKTAVLRNAVRTASFLFSAFMAVGRLISGVHWLTDIAGGVLLSASAFCFYKAAAAAFCRSKG